MDKNNQPTNLEEFETQRKQIAKSRIFYCMILVCLLILAYLIFEIATLCN